MADEVLTDATARSSRSRSTAPRFTTRSIASSTSALREALAEAQDASVRCVVVTGAGKGFCAGQDLKEFGEVSASIDESLEQTYHPNVRLIRSLAKPVIAAVNGPAAGAGLSFACACDVRVASEAATFVPGFIGIGLVPDAGGTWFVHRLLGFSRAFEWMSSNRRLTAAEALEWGLVSEVIPAGDFEIAGRRAGGRVGVAADARDREDEAALRARLRRGARSPALARGEPAAGVGGHRGLHRGRQRVPREASAGVHRPLSDAASSGSSSGLFDYLRLRYPGQTTGYLLLVTDRYPSFSDAIERRDGRLPHGRRAVPDRDGRRSACSRARRSSSAAASPASTSTATAACSSSSRAVTPTCTAATSCRRTTTGPTSGSSSSTTRATRRRAVTGRSRSSRGRSTRASSSGRRARTASSSTCPRAGSRRGLTSPMGACGRCAFATSPRSSGGASLEAGGRVVDVAFGGAFYASLEERVEPGELARLIDLGRRIKADLEAAHEVVHPLEPELRDVYGVIFWQREADEPLTQRNVTVFADGEVDRSPCGSGTSARLALLHDEGRLGVGDELRHRSIVGSEFTGWVVAETDVGGRRAVVTDVEGTAFRTGRASFQLDPADPLGEGFLLR